MDTEGLYNNNLFENPRKITMDEIMMQRIEKMKEEIVEEERFKFRIKNNTSPINVVKMFSEVFDKMGIEIVYNEMRETSRIDSIIEISTRRISDQNLRRIMEIEERDFRLKEKIRKEIEKEFTSKFDIKQLKRDCDIVLDRKKKDEKNKKNNKKDKTIYDNARKLIRKPSGKLDWSIGKSFEEIKEQPKNTDYQEKIKWFCEKYNQDYDIIYESFKDDDLDNLTWKGEKVEFPKK